MGDNMKIVKVNETDEFIFIDKEKDVNKVLIDKYPELTMMNAMEEFNELSFAVSKCVRNGNEKHIENLAEEIADVLRAIEWVRYRFGITDTMITKWLNIKAQRDKDRNSDSIDNLIFRSHDAYNKYWENKRSSIDSQNNSLHTQSIHQEDYNMSTHIQDTPIEEIDKSYKKQIDSIIKKAFDNNKPKSKSKKKKEKGKKGKK